MLLLVRSRNSIVSTALVGGASIRDISDALHTGLVRPVYDARHLARLAGASRLRAEAASVGFTLARGATVAVDEIRRDMARARAAAASYAKRWASKATGDTVASAASAASAATVGSVRRIGAAENASAFADARAARATHLPTELLRVWDSVLDKGTCPVCENADGTIVGVRENFPDGEPGSVHAFCRCSWTLLNAYERDQGFYAEAA